jgi:hypothetical protein
MAYPVEKRLLNEPIVLPANPLTEVLKVFGRDQVIALLVNTLATAVAGSFVANATILALAGPIMEKIGFFIGHIKEPSGIKKGFRSLIKDIAAHDPIYAFLMYLGLKLYEVPAWMLAISSFVIALAIVAVGEVVVTEIRYRLQFIKYKRMGFKLESYFESRFYIKKANTEEILEDLVKEFGLFKRETAKYHDLYFESRLKNYNGRIPNFRLRQRTVQNNQTLQIVYTKPAEMPDRYPRQFNYYPSRKDKLWVSLPESMPWKIEDIKDKEIRSFARKIMIKPTREIFFTREAIRNPKNILISVDQIETSGEPLTVIEIKAHLDGESKKMLIKAMRYVMLKYEVIQTTHSKNSLAY